ncbi:MAG: 30S ribosomal protein S2 [Candidatus Saccharibacteria bacterium]|nr:30S ribosomal protein S2 [Candidatus Saccharibacteria bacterium]
MATTDVDPVENGATKKATQKKPTVSDGVDPEGNARSESVSTKNKKSAPTNNVSDGVDIKKLMESGAHFGHKTSRWHPKMAPYIHSKRGGTHIIDLTETVEAIEDAMKFMENTAAHGKQVLMVGTKRQAYDVIKDAAKQTAMPYVVERWIGGMLTNKSTIGARIKHLKDLEKRMENGQLEAKYNKLEVQRFQEDIDEMNHNYGGIKDMTAKPGAMFVIDINEDANAVREARRLNIPVVALVDTNTDPTDIDHPIPCNDDAIKAIKLVTDYMVAAIEKGKAKAKAAPAKKEDAGKNPPTGGSNGASASAAKKPAQAKTD